MSRRCVAGWFTGVLIAASLLGAGAASGAAPTFERIDVDDTFADEFLSEECGVPVTTTVRGHITVRTFTGDKTGLAELRTLNLSFTATAGDRTFRWRDVGADNLQVKPDGTMVLTIVGQVPFGFAGALKIDPETEEVILEPRDRSEAQLESACAALTGE